MNSAGELSGFFNKNAVAAKQISISVNHDAVMCRFNLEYDMFLVTVLTEYKFFFCRIKRPNQFA